MPIRRSPNGARHVRSQPGRNRPERVVAINRNAWSQSVGTGGRNHPVRAIHRFARLLSVVALTQGALIFGAAAQVRNDGVLDANGNLNSLIARHAAANNLPEDLVRRVIRRESRGNARAISKGNYGLMQIRLGTARALGYRGGIEGLLDADTNMTYAVKYLAGAYQVAGGNSDRAVHYYAAGYYYAAKRQGLPTPGSEAVNAFASASLEPVPAEASERYLATYK